MDPIIKKGAWKLKGISNFFLVLLALEIQIIQCLISSSQQCFMSYPIYFNDDSKDTSVTAFDIDGFQNVAVGGLIDTTKTFISYYKPGNQVQWTFSLQGSLYRYISAVKFKNNLKYSDTVLVVLDKEKNNNQNTLYLIFSTDGTLLFQIKDYGDISGNNEGLLKNLNSNNVLYSSEGKVIAAGSSKLNGQMNMIILQPQNPISQTESILYYQIQSRAYSLVFGQNEQEMILGSFYIDNASMFFLLSKVHVVTSTLSTQWNYGFFYQDLTWLLPYTFTDKITQIIHVLYESTMTYISGCINSQTQNGIDIHAFYLSISGSNSIIENRIVSKISSTETCLQIFSNTPGELYFLNQNVFSKVVILLKASNVLSSGVIDYHIKASSAQRQGYVMSFQDTQACDPIATTSPILASYFIDSDPNLIFTSLAFGQRSDFSLDHINSAFALSSIGLLNLPQSSLCPSTFANKPVSLNIGIESYNYFSQNLKKNGGFFYEITNQFVGDDGCDDSNRVYDIQLSFQNSSLGSQYDFNIDLVSNTTTLNTQSDLLRIEPIQYNFAAPSMTVNLGQFGFWPSDCDIDYEIIQISGPLAIDVIIPVPPSPPVTINRNLISNSRNLQAGAPITADKNIITIFTNNIKAIGTYILQLKSFNLLNPFNWASTEFIVQIGCELKISYLQQTTDYYLRLGQNRIITFQGIKFLSKCSYPIKYESTLVDGSKLPSFIKFNQNKMSYSIFSVNIADVGLYKMKIKAIIQDFNKTYDDSFTWTFNMTADPLSETNQYAPRFETTLAQLNLLVGQSFAYNLPKISLQFSFNPMPEDVGLYQIPITLIDNGYPSMKNFYVLAINVTTMLTVSNLQQQLSQIHVQQEDIDEYYLFNKEFKAKVKNIQADGLMTLQFYHDWTFSEIYNNFSNIKIEILFEPVQEQQARLASWEIIKFQRKILSIQLNFEYPQEISLAERISNYWINQLKQFSKLLTLDWAQIQYSSFSFWSAVNNLQLIVYFPMLKINMPSNAQYFINMLIDLTNFNVFPENEVQAKILSQYIYDLPEDKQQAYLMPEEYSTYGYENILYTSVFSNALKFLAIGVFVCIIAGLLAFMFPIMSLIFLRKNRLNIETKQFQDQFSTLCENINPNRYFSGWAFIYLICGNVCINFLTIIIVILAQIISAIVGFLSKKCKRDKTVQILSTTTMNSNSPQQSSQSISGAKSQEAPTNFTLDLSVLTEQRIRLNPLYKNNLDNRISNVINYNDKQKDLRRLKKRSVAIKKDNDIVSIYDQFQNNDINFSQSKKLYSKNDDINY
ncbi:cadg domain containing protein [Stylonychia lemnae]|uniref:Cadg domain containing protein n=1 Tax=Stylonychia lemnae TaxID=5949 RepID=A0A078B0M3_STYLE|nr:cadg domain containing protein [Stylonychia lemnae]|eukprot:CDW88089.1 cadg domain containing protein [Stylonychia lemnae]